MIMPLASLLFGILAFVAFAILLLYPGEIWDSPLGSMFSLLLTAAAAVIGVVLGVISAVKCQRADQPRNRLATIGLRLSLTAAVIIVGFVFLAVWWAIQFDRHDFASDPQPVDGAVGFISVHDQTRLELVFRTLDWDCQPDGAGYACQLEFEVKALDLEAGGESIAGQRPPVTTIGPGASFSRLPGQWPTVNSLEQRVVDRCYRQAQGLFQRSDSCSSPGRKYVYGGYVDQERRYQAWDFSWPAEDGTCRDQPVGPGETIVCQSLFRLPQRPDFVSYHWQGLGRNSFILLPGAEAAPAL